MASYYSYFSQPLSDPVVSVPYFDAFGLGNIHNFTQELKAHSFHIEIIIYTI